MFDIGIWELLIISVVALVVVGPKDFPVFLRTVGRTIGKVKGIARDFQGTMEDVAKDMELEEIRKANRDMANLGNIDMTSSVQKPDASSENKPKVESTEQS
jgi:sec-independent protein translocase protein TatB